MNDGLDGLHLHACPRKLQSARTDLGHQPAHQRAKPVGHGPQGQAAGRTTGIFQKTFDGTGTSATASRSGDGDLMPEQSQQLGSGVISHDQPLLPFPPHVTDSDVGQCIGVIDTGAASERKEIRGQLGQRQHQKRNSLGFTIGVADLHVIIGTKLKVSNRLRRVGQQPEKRMKSLRGRIVRARRTDHIEPLKAKFFFQRTQRVDLAGNTNHGKPLDALRTGRLQHGQQRGIAHAHATALGHVLFGTHECGHRAPGVVGVGRHGEYRIHHFLFQ